MWRTARIQPEREDDKLLGASIMNENSELEVCEKPRAEAIDEGPPPFSDAQLHAIAGQDNDEQITAARVGHPFVYHVGMLSEDRQHDPSVDDRALTASGLQYLGLACLTQKRDDRGVFVYYITPRAPIKVKDCIRAKKLAIAKRRRGEQS